MARTSRSTLGLHLLGALAFVRAAAGCTYDFDEFENLGAPVDASARGGAAGAPLDGGSTAKDGASQDGRAGGSDATRSDASNGGSDGSGGAAGGGGNGGSSGGTGGATGAGGNSGATGSGGAGGTTIDGGTGGAGGGGGGNGGSSAGGNGGTAGAGTGGTNSGGTDAGGPAGAAGSGGAAGTGGTGGTGGATGGHAGAGTGGTSSGGAAGSGGASIDAGAPDSRADASRDAGNPPFDCASVNGRTFEGHCYFARTTAVTWDVGAERACATPAHLVTITSAEEQEFVSTFLAGQSRWIGLRRPANAPKNAASYEWVTGEARTYNRWYAQNGEPDFDGECVRLGSPDRWGDHPCNAEFPVICERE